VSGYNWIEVSDMPLTISDELLKDAGLTEREALIEFACRMFDADRLTKPMALRVSGLSRVEFERELINRGLPIIHYTEEMWEQDLEALAKMDAGDSHGASGT
jgi:predicted HTH domain antitoxin